jgi:ComF family protein
LCDNSVEKLTDGATCQDCWRKTRIFTGAETLCQKCGRLLEHSAITGKTEIINCHRCNNDFFDIARAVGVYEGALRVAALELKEKPFIALRLKNLLTKVLHKSPFDQTTRIIPVPLHPNRFRERGFNQAAVLGGILSRESKLQMSENCLVREVYTKLHRGGMDEKARRETVEKSFVVRQPRLVEKEKILLVDDVFTSGATASACAKALKESGANEVFVLTIARAV